MKYIIIFFLFVITLITFFLLNKLINKKSIENFCKIPEANPSGSINDKKVLLDYPPQSNILTSSCDQYWKDWPLESNSSIIEQSPLVLKTSQLSLPKEKQFGDNNYKAGIFDFKRLAEIISDNVEEDLFKTTTELLIDPISKENLQYKYKLNFAYLELNRKTWINRWEKYNPSVKKDFNYDDIKSSISAINVLNLEFKRRCDTFQKELLSDSELVLYGLIPFEIFKYKILNINYFNNNPEKTLYIIEIALFRESDLYLNTFSYLGYIDNDRIIITNAKYIGRNTTDTVLLADYYNPNEITEDILNSNFSNSPILEKNPDAILNLTKAYQESYKLKNQYACFNLNYNVNNKDTYILPYYSRESCESSTDPYGRLKTVGIYDTPCKVDTDCPFFNQNKNYDNNFGKCKDDGYCELPINMEAVGYRYFKSDPNKKPLCYNCKTTQFNIFSELDSCCQEQFDTVKYGFLKSPDYAFDNDYLVRQNYFYKNYCTQKPDTYDLECTNINLLTPLNT
jgi:hypothetical protein